MSAATGWMLACAFTALAWWQYGWQGVVFALTVVVFWLLLQFNRALRVMKTAAASPIGQVGSAVMLNSKLKAGMTLMEVLVLTRSLGKRITGEPERYEWIDSSGSTVVLTLERGRCARWELRRESGHA